MEASSLGAKAWQYGVLGVVALVFGYAIIHLFKHLRAQNKTNEEAQVAMAREREGWARKEVEIRFEYEKRHRELVQDSAKTAREDLEQAREDFAEILAQVQASAEKQSTALVATLEKFYERFLGGRPRF